MSYIRGVLISEVANDIHWQSKQVDYYSTRGSTVHVRFSDISQTALKSNLAKIVLSIEANLFMHNIVTTASLF